MNTEENPSSTSSDHPSQGTPDHLTRRGFLCTSCGCALATGAVATRLHAGWGDPIPAGALKDYAKDEISEAYVKYNFFVTRHMGQLFATTATCPHQGNYLFRDQDNPERILCSGHDAVFDPAGRPISGRVSDSLVRFGIAVDEKGIVRVDPNKEFPESQWDEKGSFVAVPEA